MYSTVKTKIDTVMAGLSYTESPALFNIEKLPSSIFDKSYFVEFVKITTDAYLSGNEMIEAMIINVNIGYEITSTTSYNTAIGYFEAVRDEFAKSSNYVSGTVKTDFADACEVKWFDTKTNIWLIGKIPLMIIY